MAQETKYVHLFTPFKIGKLTVKNRIAYAPVGTGTSANGTSAFSVAEEDYYAARAKGGAGLIFTGSTQTDLEIDKYTPGALGTWNINYNPALYKLTATRVLDRVHSYGARMFAQLTLGVGRNSGMKSPSPIPTYADPSVMSPVLTTDELKKKIEYFIRGAVIAKDCGYDGIEVHAMHFGYLLDELEMLISNQRTDEYGGSFENRMRAAKEIVEGVKAACGKDFPVSMRLGMKSYMKGFNRASITGEPEVGRTIEDAVRVAKYLESVGYDLLSVDTGTYDSYYYCYPPMYIKMGVNVDLAAQVKAAVNIPVIVCGRMHSPELCEETVASGKADGVVIGRAMLADPDFAVKAKLNRADEIRPCLSCNFGCRGRMQGGLGLSCAVNPTLMHESSYALTPAAVKKNVMVIGGGVAGMEAARAASLRGHKVTVYEQSGRLGGIFNVAGIPDFKEEDRKLVRWYEARLREQGVEIVLNKPVDLDFILSVNPDVVISATGSEPIVPKISGLDNPKCVGFVDAMEGRKEVGRKVVVVGGGLVGCEVALNFARKGHEVKIVEFLDGILKSGAPTPIMNRLCLEDMFEELNVEVLTSSALTGVNDNGAVIKHNGEEVEVKADTVILAVGLRSRPSFAPELEKYSIEAYSIGDERTVANIYNATSNGYEVGRSI